MYTELSNDSGKLLVTLTPEGLFALHAQPNGFGASHTDVVTDYPLELIEAMFKEFGAMYTVDEIGRDVADNDAQLDVRYSVLAYFPDELLSQPLKILDYGCGSGSSTFALARLFPNATIIGVYFVAKYLKFARL